MPLIQIKLINGEPMGRPVNPYCITTQEDLYLAFEQSVTYHPAPGCEESDGVEAVLRWQAQNPINDVWYDCGPGYLAVDTRQIWRLIPSQQKDIGVPLISSQKVEVKEVEQQLLDQPKEQVMERQFKNNCDYGFKQPNVNKFIRLAFESGFENGMNYQKYSNHPDTKK